MPNPGKPAQLKILSGSRRLAQHATTAMLPVVQAVSSPPAWLPNADAIAEWERLAPILVANRLLTEAALSVLAHVCAVHGSIARTLRAGGQPKAALVGQYRLLLNDFGFTPAFASKVGAAPQPPGPNRFIRKRPGG